MHKIDIDEYSGNYIIDVINNPVGPDIRAFRIGLIRYARNTGNKVFQILKSGPIPCSNEELDKYIAVYERGMNEVKSFLNQN